MKFGGCNIVITLIIMIIILQFIENQQIKEVFAANGIMLTI